LEAMRETGAGCRRWRAGVMAARGGRETSGRGIGPGETGAGVCGLLGRFDYTADEIANAEHFAGVGP